MEAAARVLGETPQVRFARPPYGDLSQSFLQLCQERGLVPTFWTTGWGFASSKFGPVLDSTQAGDIILMHLRPADLDNLEQALPALRQKRIHPVTMSRFYDVVNNPSRYPVRAAPNYRLGVLPYPE
jgi:hypothetical protein